MKNNISFYENGLIEILYAETKHSFPIHSHESFCVGVVIDGTASFSINNDKKQLNKAMGFIIPSDIAISINANRIYKYIIICFKDDYKKIFDHIKFKNYYFNVESIDSILSMCKEYEKNRDDNKFINLILKLITNSVEYDFYIKEKHTDEIIEQASKYIINHANEKFNLDNLARLLHISKYHFIRIFKREMGVTPNQYYIQAKIRCIKKEVFDNKNETELAAKFKFADQSHLCKLFKKRMGISIRDYKNNLTRN